MISFVSLAIYVGYKVTNPKVMGINQHPFDYGLTFEDVSFTTSDGVTLKGWWIPDPDGETVYSEKAVIFAHGYGHNRVMLNRLKLAKTLTKEGYSVLMFDFRNSGLSQKDESTIGLKEQIDLMTAINFVAKEKGIKNIGLMGWSMGASTSIVTGVKSKYVKAVIADSPFADLEKYSKESFTKWTGLPSFLATGVTVIVEHFTELQTEKVKPVAAAKKYNDEKGLFLIHNKQDGRIPYKQSEIINNEATNSEIWTPAKGGHIRTYQHYQKQYEEKTIAFLNKYMEPTSYYKKTVTKKS